MFWIVALTIGALDSTILAGKRLTITACSLVVRSVNGSTKDDSLDSAVGAISLRGSDQCLGDLVFSGLPGLSGFGLASRCQWAGVRPTT